MKRCQSTQKIRDLILKSILRKYGVQAFYMSREGKMGRNIFVKCKPQAKFLSWLACLPARWSRSCQPEGPENQDGVKDTQHFTPLGFHWFYLSILLTYCLHIPDKFPFNTKHYYYYYPLIFQWSHIVFLKSHR